MILIRKVAIIFFDILDHFVHQKRIIKYFKSSLTNIDTFIDIGCHKGTYTDLILKNFEVKKVIMVEPQKNIFKYTKKKYKKKKQIFVYNCAISNTENKKTIFINKHDLTSSLTKVDKKNSYLNLKAKLFGGSIDEMITKRYQVKCKKLINIINEKKIKKVDLLKIDTEGHELQVLKSSGNFLRKNVKHLLIEFHNSKIFVNYSSLHIHNYLKKNNFKLQKKIKFPFTAWEDRIYLNNNFF